MKVKKAIGLDKISARLLRDAAWVIAPSLNYINNSSLNFGKPYLGKAGLTKIALKRFSVLMHFQRIVNALKSISNAF